MARPGSKANSALPDNMYVRHRKRKATYYTIIKGERITLGSERGKGETKLGELINGKRTADMTVDMCAQFIAHHRALIEHDAVELAESTV
jgi:hypothetical protein